MAATEEVHTDELCGSLRMRKPERLRHKRLVDRLFSRGRSFYAYPLKVVYLLDSLDDLLAEFKSRRDEEQRPVVQRLAEMRIEHLQMLVTVPKRKMRHAVDRVWLRRRVKEAWRLSRVALRERLKEHHRTMSVALVYVGNEKHPYATIEKKMQQIMERLIKQLESTLEGK